MSLAFILLLAAFVVLLAAYVRAMRGWRRARAQLGQTKAERRKELEAYYQTWSASHPDPGVISAAIEDALACDPRWGR